MTSKAEQKAARVEGLVRLKRRLLALAGPAAEAAIVKANAQNAEDFRATVARVIPRGDPKDGQLADTLAVEALPPTATQVSIGSPAHPYPLHLETGHRAKGGQHVPGKAYWFPSKQVTKKRAHNRVVRAERQAIKAAVAAGAGASNE